MKPSEILDWLQHNKDWVFSGAGVTVVLGIVAILRWLFKPKAANPNTPALQIKLGFGGLTYDGPPYLSDQMMLFSVANPTSDRPTQLTSIHLPLNGANMVFPHLDGERQMPCMIAPATAVRFWVPLSDVKERLRSRGFAFPLTIQAVASDALGNEYASDSATLVAD
jgi:hypothetical protein